MSASLIQSTAILKRGNKRQQARRRLFNWSPPPSSILSSIKRQWVAIEERLTQWHTVAVEHFSTADRLKSIYLVFVFLAILTVFSLFVCVFFYLKKYFASTQLRQWIILNENKVFFIQQLWWHLNKVKQAWRFLFSLLQLVIIVLGHWPISSSLFADWWPLVILKASVVGRASHLQRTLILLGHLVLKREMNKESV